MRKMICGIVLVGLMIVLAPPVFAANNCCWDWIPGVQGADDTPKTLCPGGDVDCAPDVCLTPGGEPCPTGAEGDKCVCESDKKQGSAPDPANGAPAGWAECTPIPKAACFQRQNVQMYWVDWICVPGSVAPNGAVPGPGNGYGCTEKPDLVDLVSEAKDVFVTFPAEAAEGIVIEKEPVSCGVVCQDGEGEKLRAEVGGCHAACDAFCGSNELVKACMSGGQNLKARVPAVSTIGAAVLVVFLIVGAAWVFRHKAAFSKPAA